MRDDVLLTLYSRPETVFSVSEIAMLFPRLSLKSLQNRLYYFSKIGKLIKMHQGIYAKKEYNFLEAANKLYTPSYISLETVLRNEGVVFQYYETIFLVSYLTRMITINKRDIQYRQIKQTVLTNIEGIEQKDGYSIATRERAFLDAIYIYKDYHFDHLDPIDWEKVEVLKKIYDNKNFEKSVNGYYKIYKEER